jgi:hypothetical protein
VAEPVKKTCLMARRAAYRLKVKVEVRSGKGKVRAEVPAVGKARAKVPVGKVS